MAQRDFIHPRVFGLGLGLDAIPLSYIQGSYPNYGSQALYLPGQQHQSITGEFWEQSLDSIDSASFMSFENSTGTRPPLLLVQAEDPARRPPATVATPPCTPLPPPKRGRGRPRKNGAVPTLKRKVRTFLSSPSTLQASSPEVFADKNNEDPCCTSLSSDSAESSRPAHTTVKLKGHYDRNCEAAQKYHTRKQLSTQKRVADSANAQGINESLQRETDRLREELLLLQNILLQHGDCDGVYM